MSFTDPTSNIEYKISMFLPQNYYSRNDDFAVMYFVPGRGSTAYGGAQLERYKTYFNAGKIAEAIIVRFSSAANSGRATDVIPNAVIPYIESNFRAKTDRIHRAIYGFSAGGAATMSLLMNHPELFVAGFGIDPATMGKPDNAAWLAAQENLENILKYDVKVRITAGNPMGASSKTFIDKITALEIPAEYEFTDCGHQVTCILDTEKRKSFEFLGELLENKDLQKGEGKPAPVDSEATEESPGEGARGAGARGRGARGAGERGAGARGRGRMAVLMPVVGQDCFCGFSRLPENRGYGVYNPSSLDEY